MDSSKPQPLDLLQQYWGHQAFLDCQEEAIAAALAGRDSLTVLPTGGGKSVCYQLPALLCEGVAIVVSPLIALMKDQVDALRLNGIRAAAVNSAMTMAERLETFNALRAGELSLLYVSPEKLVQERTLDYFKTLNLSFIAIDEAHCISQWGHDFRPEYRRLGCLKEHFPGVALHAYTATATAAVREDIAAQLNLEEPLFLVGSFDRPNLTYRVRRKNSNHPEQILEVLRRHAGVSAIIYCQSRREVDELSRLLKEIGLDAYPYHAGMGDLERKVSQEAFIGNDAAIMVATVAFGMGVDKSNVRLVLHSGMPKALENYQQESGRAGRDGLAAECILFHGSADLQRWQRNLRENDVGAGRAGAERSLAAMLDYIHGNRCRHRALVEYFGQEFVAGSCGACDICMGELDEVDDSLVRARMILSSVLRQGENFGADYTAQVLKGSRARRIRGNHHDRLSTWGLLRDEPLAVIKEWIEQLVCQEFLCRDSEYGLLRVTPDGRRLLHAEGAVRLLRLNSSAKSAAAEAPAKVTREFDSKEAELFEKLRALRFELARERQMAPYLIFSDVSLADMVFKRPVDPDHFARIKGVGERKLNEFAEPFTALIAVSCAEYDLKTNLEPEVRIELPKGPGGLTATGRTAAEYFAKGESIAVVAARLERAESTVCGYLLKWLKAESICDPSPWVDPDEARRIESAIAEHGDELLKPLYLALNQEISYDKIRIVVTCRRNRGKMETDRRNT